MRQYSYTAFDLTGKARSGVLEALTNGDAIARLRAEGLFPAVLEECQRDSPAPAARPGSREHARKAGHRHVAGATPEPVRRRASSRYFAPRISKREIATFMRQLSVLLRSGLPVVRALEILGRQESNESLREVICVIANEVRTGSTLSDAMARQARHFDRLFLNLIRAGEAAGALDVVTDRLARFSEKSLALQAKVRTAMVYPLVVLSVAVVILAGLLIFVVPKFQQIFADLLKGAPLPPLTQAVLTFSNVVRECCVLIGASVGAVIVAFKIVARIPTLAAMLDNAVLRAPILGKLAMKSQCARFTRTLGTLLLGGVPILGALLIARDTTTNARIARAIGLIHDRVKCGDPVARVVGATGIFPPMVAGMIDVGEQTGQLNEMLVRIADIQEEEVDRAAEGLSSLVEPVLILALALIVGTIVIALFLPIVRMVQLLS